MTTAEVVASTADPAFATDVEGRITAWNRGAQALLGIPPERAIGRRCYELLNGRDAWDNRFCAERCALRSMAERGEPAHRMVVGYRTARSGRVWAEVSVLVLPGESDAERELIHLLRPSQVDQARPQTAGLDGDHPLPADGVAHLARLTRREREILALLAEGCDTRGIARRLEIRVSTVRNHVQNLLQKLGVHSRVEAIAVGRRSGVF